MLILAGAKASATLAWSLRYNLDSLADLGIFSEYYLASHGSGPWFSPRKAAGKICTTQKKIQSPIWINFLQGWNRVTSTREMAVGDTAGARTFKWWCLEFIHLYTLKIYTLCQCPRAVLAYLGGTVDKTQHCFAGVEISTLVVLLCILLTLFSVSLSFVPRLVIVRVRNQNEPLSKDMRMNIYLNEYGCEKIQICVLGTRLWLTI